MRKLRWTALALESYTEEQEYILSKWNQAEVRKFAKLVEKALAQIITATNEGALISATIRKLIISKQTTLYFRITDDSSTIQLLLFWNNQKSPAALKQILHNI